MDFDQDTPELQGEGSQKVIRKADKFTTFHMVAFIITAVAGREYSGWQPALTQGFAQFMIAEILLAAAFINSYLCLAEIWSAVPFSGGGYGLARAMMGFYPGFLVGCADALVYITHSAVGALFLGDKICEIAGLNSHLTLVFVFLVYLLAVSLSVQPSIVFVRRSFVALAVISVGILLIYVFGSLGWTDFNQNASLHKAPAFSDSGNWISGTLSNFMIWLPFAALPYAGVKSFTLMCAVTDTPKVTLPKAISIALPIIFGLNMFVVFVNAAQPGGILNTSRLGVPMSVGFEKMFNVSADVAYQMAAFLSFPAAFGKVYAYMIPSGTLLQSLGRTNLLPSFMMLRHNKDHTQGTIVTAILGFLMCILIHFQPQIDLYNICVLATAFSNITSSYCYIKLRNNCPTLEKGYVNPLGVTGAVMCAVLFLLMFVSAAFLQPSYDAPIGIAVLFVLLTVYYYGFAAKTQTLCKEEDKVFLLLHVKNFNRNKKRAASRLKGSRVSILKLKASNDSSHLRSPSEGASMGSTSKVASEVSVGKAAAEPYGGLWALVRKFHNRFGNNLVAPFSAGNAVGESSANSVSVCPVGASVSVAPLPVTNETNEVNSAEESADVDVRGAELV